MTLFLILMITLTIATDAQRWIENQGLWYFFPPIDERQPYFEAMNYCSDINSQLVTVVDQIQNDFIANRIKSESWIGYYHTSGHFCGGSTRYPMWTDDENCILSFTNSLTGSNDTEPYGVAINKLGSWTKIKQDIKLNFVCQWQCKKIVVQNENVKFKANGIYEISGFRLNRKFYKNEVGVYLVYYETSGSKLWVIGEVLSGSPYYYFSTNGNERYVPDTWNIPTDWRINAKFVMTCKACTEVSLDYDGIYNGTYTALVSYDNNESCDGIRSKIYEKKDANTTFYLYVAEDRWFVGSDNCTEGWILYNTDYTPLPCMSQGLWLDRASTETTTQPTITPMEHTATTIQETTMLQSTPRTEQKEDPFNYFFIIIPVLGILLIIIIITIIIVCVRKRNEQDEKPPPDIVETSPLPSASQVDEHTNVVKRNGDVGIRNSFQDESIFAQHDELPEKAMKKKTKKK